MTAARGGRRKRHRGEVEELPSGSLRVKVYAGVDPLSGRRVYLSETIPAGPKASAEAEQAKTRLLNQVDEQRNPRTRATVNQLMDRYLELLDVDTNTRRGYEGYIRNHVRPLLGTLPVGRLDGETLDSFYAVLRTCRAHCGGRQYIEHSTADPHTCDGKCRPHVCRPLAASSIRQIHWCLRGALQRAVRWRWIGVNPIDQAATPKASRPDPHPPTPEQAARILNAAFKDLPWGMLVWVAMTTGARRGEICALRWDGVDFAGRTLTIKTSIAQDSARTWEKDTKTHQQRRIALDDESIALLRNYRAWCEQLASDAGVMVAENGRVFSDTPDHSTWIKPDTVSQRYRRMCAKLGWDMNIHQLRHFSATELISAGVDVRTVAGRLGHGGGGATTLRVYSAWVSEADQRAATNLAIRMPRPPITLNNDGIAEPVADDEDEPNSPYKRIAADLRGAINCGAIRPGDQLPTAADLAHRYHVAASTAHRAIADLRTAGLIIVSRGRRAIVADSGERANSS
jgi:integrase